MNLAYIAGYTRKHINCEISILDAETFGLNYEDIEKRIKKIKPDVIGISSPTPAFNHVVEITKIIKEIDCKIIVIVGGPHPTAFQKETAGIESIDFAVKGEGEITFAELVEAISSGRKSYGSINGIAYKDTGNIVVTPERELINNIDDIPFPARDLFDLDSYYQAPTKKVSNYKSTSLMTARGCPYDCIHCISKLIWKRRIRYRDVVSIVDEIEECINLYNIREFNFYDDTFTLNKKRVIKVCREIRKRELNIAWVCFGRVNIIDREMVKEMKKAGCRKISFGLESGSQKILDIMRKNTTLEMGRKAVSIVDEAGLDVHASFMFGNIEETKETIRKTIDYAKSLKIDNATFFITAPFPGTDLYTIAREKGYIGDDVNWEHFAPITKSKPVLIQDNLSQEELIEWQKRAFKEFYLRPVYLIRKLSKISSLDDIKMLVEGLGVFFRLQKK